MAEMAEVRECDGVMARIACIFLFAFGRSSDPQPGHPDIRRLGAVAAIASPRADACD